MKTIPILLSVLLLCGCASNNKKDQCDKMRAAYELYQSSLLVREPSKDEIAAAKAAAAFLSLYCGWQTSSTERGLNTDVNGVPIIVPN